MVDCQVSLTRRMADLLETFAEVNYGQLMDVEVPEDDGQLVKVTQVSRPVKEFFDLLKENQFFTLIKVHQGAPTMAETPFTSKHGFRCIKQHRFNS